MPQPPNLRTVHHVLERASVIHGPETAEYLAEGLSDDWTAAADRGHEQSHLRGRVAATPCTQAPCRG